MYLADDLYFIHVPKNGGSSIESLFREFDGRHQHPRVRNHPKRDFGAHPVHIKDKLRKLVVRAQELSQPSDAKDVGLVYPRLVMQHLTLRERLGLGLLDAERLPNLEVVFVFRNPYSRLLSLFHEYSRDQALQPNVTLDAFVSSLIQLGRREAAAPKVQAMHSPHNDVVRSRSQFEFIDLQGSIWENSGARVTGLRFEQLGDDWSRFARDRNLPTKLPRLNSSASDTLAWSKLAAQRTTALVNRTFKADFEAFGYQQLGE